MTAIQSHMFTVSPLLNILGAFMHINKVRYAPKDREPTVRHSCKHYIIHIFFFQHGAPVQMYSINNKDDSLFYLVKCDPKCIQP